MCLFEGSLINQNVCTEFMVNIAAAAAAAAAAAVLLPLLLL